MCRGIAFIILLVVFVNQSYADEILWESGVNLFIKITKQDKSKSGKTLPNNHPVTLNEKDIREALGLVEIWTKDFITLPDWRNTNLAEYASNFNWVNNWLNNHFIKIYVERKL